MDHSPLHVLSGELRNIIYSYLWPDQEEVIICLCGSHHPMRSHLRNPKADDVWIYAGSTLPLVCRQLRQETLGYFYNVSSFVLPVTWVLLAGGQFKLEAQWRRFVQVFGVEMVRQIKHMTVLAGKINEISVIQLPATDNQTEEDRAIEISCEVDPQCTFARCDIRPCLHPAARMLVLVEHSGDYQVRARRFWIDFDDQEATLVRLWKAEVLEEWNSSNDDWACFWSILVDQWYGDNANSQSDDVSENPELAENAGM
jgi:hypothetical protein